MAKIVDYSDEVYRELGEPDDISIATISSWFRANYKKINVILNKNFTLNASLEIVDELNAEITEDEVAIFKCLYNIDYCRRQIRKFLGVGGIDVALEVSSDGGVVTLLNRNEISKTYLSAQREYSSELKNLVNSYKIRKYRPQQVTGDDNLSPITTITQPTYPAVRSVNEQFNF